MCSLLQNEMQNLWRMNSRCEYEVPASTRRTGPQSSVNPERGLGSFCLGVQRKIELHFLPVPSVPTKEETHLS